MAASDLPTPDLGADIEAPAILDRATGCAHKEGAGAAAFRRLVMTAMPTVHDGGIMRACDPDPTKVSEHEEGRAWDAMCSKADGDALCAWLLAPDAHGNAFAMARRAGVMYLIWQRQIWRAWTGEWGPYEGKGKNPHTDHVHVSFSRKGGRGETSLYDWLAGRGMFQCPPPSSLAGVALLLLGAGVLGASWWALS